MNSKTIESPLHEIQLHQSGSTLEIKATSPVHRIGYIILTGMGFIILGVAWILQLLDVDALSSNVITFNIKLEAIIAGFIQIFIFSLIFALAIGLILSKTSPNATQNPFQGILLSIILIFFLLSSYSVDIIADLLSINKFTVYRVLWFFMGVGLLLFQYIEKSLTIRLVITNTGEYISYSGANL